jgi:hypothetical protein
MTNVNWKLHDYDDALAAPAEVDYVVHRVFMRPSLNILYGAPGAFKSLIMAHLCLHVAAGRSWLHDTDFDGFPTEKSAVLWVDADNGYWRTANRFSALGRDMKLDPPLPLHWVSMPSPPLRANDAESMLILKQIMEARGTDLCVIDNLGLITGGIDENSAQMSLIMANLRALSEGCGTCMVLIHHERKGGATGRSGEALRGHSSIEAAIDLALKITREDDSPSCHIRATKTRDVPVPRLCLEFYHSTDAGEGSLHTAGFFRRQLETGLDRQLRIEENIQNILGARRRGIAKTTLAHLVKEQFDNMPGVNVIRAIIGDMVVDGKLVARKEGQRVRIQLKDDAPPTLFDDRS